MYSNTCLHKQYEYAQSPSTAPCLRAASQSRTASSTLATKAGFGMPMLLKPVWWYAKKSDVSNRGSNSTKLPLSCSCCNSCCSVQLQNRHELAHMKSTIKKSTASTSKWMLASFASMYPLSSASIPSKMASIECRSCTRSLSRNSDERNNGAANRRTPSAFPVMNGAQCS